MSGSKCIRLQPGASKIKLKDVPNGIQLNPKLLPYVSKNNKHK